MNEKTVPCCEVIKTLPAKNILDSGIGNNENVGMTDEAVASMTTD